MTPQERIEVLKELIKASSDNIFGSHFSHATEQAKQWLRELESGNVGWVKVSERNPKFDEPVLVYCNTYGRAIYTYRYIATFEGEDFGNWHDGKSLGVLPPEYWMPLPDRPEIELDESDLPF